MAVIYDFQELRKRVRAHKEAVEEAANFLDKTVYELTDLAINIAVSDAWYEWDQNVPEGTVMDFSPGVLSSCPDRNVKKLAALIEAVEEIELTHGIPGPAKPGSGCGSRP